MASDMVLVTDRETVDKDDFYLSDEWLNEIGSKAKQRNLKKMADNEELFIAYEVLAVNYVIYYQMDAHQVFINKDGEVLLQCESAVIDNKHEEKWEIE